MRGRRKKQENRNLKEKSLRIEKAKKKGGKEKECKRKGKEREL